MKTLLRLVAFLAVSVTAFAAVDVPNRVDQITHLAFVFDTSGSMRHPRTHAIYPAAIAALEEMLLAHPKVKFCQLFDFDGRPMLGARDQWLPCNADTRDEMKRALSRSLLGTSNPMPGLLHALALPLPEGAEDRIHVCVIGDEFTGEPRVALRQLERSNPDDGTGRRRAIVSAVQVPTLKDRSPESTPARFEELMTEAAKRSGGTFTVLPGAN